MKASSTPRHTAAPPFFDVRDETIHRRALPVLVVFLGLAVLACMPAPARAASAAEPSPAPLVTAAPDDTVPGSYIVVLDGAPAATSDRAADTLDDAVDAAEEQVPQCVADDEETTLAEWAESGELEVVDDVDVETFRTQADTYLRENFDEAQLAVYEAIRGEAG